MAQIKPLLLFLVVGGLSCCRAVYFEGVTAHNTTTFWLSSMRRPDADTPLELNWRTILAMVLTFVCGTFANAAGIGGGPFYMPMFNVVLGFNLELATALSHTVVACSAVASTFYGLSHPSPLDPARPLVDLDVALTFIPALLMGISIGVLFNVLFPEWLKTVLLVAVLLVVARSVLKRGVTNFKKETALKEKAREREPLLDDANSESVASLEPMPDEGPDTTKRHFKLEKLRGCTGRIPWAKLVAILALWVVFLALQLGKSKQYRCSWAYFGYFGAQVLLCGAVTALQIWQLSRELSRPEGVDPEMRSIMQGGADQMQPGTKGIRVLLKVVGIMIFSGAVAGTLGIGGALIFNPVLLQLGVHPQVCASTAVVMILFSSSGIALSFAFQHMLNVHYVVVFAPLCFVASFTGVTAVGRLVKRTGRTSLIVLIMGSLVVVGAIITALFGGVRTYEQVQDHADMGFSPFCP